MKVIKTDIEGVVIIEPQLFGDSRGYFMESYSERDFARLVAPVRFVQDNESRSRYGVVRGLHYQREPYSQSKLVRCLEGRVLDVAVDIRPESPTYGKYVAVELSADNHRQLYIPKGFAHGFAVLSKEALFAYKCDEFYHPEAECGIAWDDPTLSIDWGLPKEDIILSEKDKGYNNL
jgi:dTDP-4-dehydrorhamnose 3,5-epimerase